ncbi:MAG: DUF559 domain-containing protein [Limnochordaceae bacterium]|nr:DUF559 domain-containing protein [Limnochordaceae bacterium]
MGAEPAMKAGGHGHPPPEESFFEERLRELQGRGRHAAHPAPDHQAHHMEDRLAGLLHKAGLGPFRRRVVLGGWEVDFLFERSRLVVELDGFVHLAAPIREKDRLKDRSLAALGYRVLHVENAELRAAPDQVLRRIRQALGRQGP